MSGHFVVSLDCEGKWGMADQITAHHDAVLSEDNLLSAYLRLLTLFARYEVPVTFAFVMAFTLSEGERKEIGDRLCDVLVDGEQWLRHYRAAARRDRLDGWFCPRALDETRAHPEHEIGCHGFCHAPLAESGITRADADRELSSAGAVAAMKGLNLRTFVYPRNKIGYRSLLREHGYVGYRERLARGAGALGLARALMREFNVFENAQPGLARVDGLQPIPAGYFLNWRVGVRAKVPMVLTRRRWVSILRDAAERGDVAHLWFHPHNIIDGPETIEVLEQILKEACLLRSQNRLQFVTQQAYVEARRGPDCQTARNIDGVDGPASGITLPPAATGPDD
jgi:peptidoglycan/xylan/chitin deacetylase (PgdA/CDA1 family)